MLRAILISLVTSSTALAADPFAQSNLVAWCIVPFDAKKRSPEERVEMLVRLGLSPREALAAATNNYAIQFGWNEIGQVAPGRRADILVLDSDPTTSVWNARRISTLIMDGNVVDRDALLHLKK